MMNTMIMMNMVKNMVKNLTMTQRSLMYPDRGDKPDRRGSSLIPREGKSVFGVRGAEAGAGVDAEVVILK